MDLKKGDYVTYDRGKTIYKIQEIYNKNLTVSLDNKVYDVEPGDYKLIENGKDVLEAKKRIVKKDDNKLKLHK